MDLSNPLAGFRRTGTNGGGAGEIGVAAIGFDCDGGEVDEDIYNEWKLNLVRATTTH
jgi:hypothetical protein